jgi:hypothetical protein
MEKYGRIKQAIDDNIIWRRKDARIQIYRTLIIFNMYCFPTATMVTRTRLNITVSLLSTSGTYVFRTTNTINTD